MSNVIDINSKQREVDAHMNRIALAVQLLARTFAEMREIGLDTPAIVRMLKHAIEEMAP